jgi:four helix bundle protein
MGIKMKSVKDLNVYKLAFETCITIYKITESFPKTETFGLVSQMRRAAISICSNLSEGCSRNSTSEYKHFVGIAKGSASELSFHIDIAIALGFIKESDALTLTDNINNILKMLSGLINSLTSKSNQPNHKH